MADPNSSTSGASSNAPVAPAPVVGAISIPGRQRSMEDAISVRPNLCSPNLSRGQPVDFFAVYDGHGGPHAAALCGDRMYLILQEELMLVRTTVDMSSSGGGSRRGRRERLERQRVTEAWKRVLRRCFHRIDEMASFTCCECGTGTPCGCPPNTLGMAGSTAVMAVVTEESIIVANCGDSRAVLSRGGRAIPLSFDHKPDRQDERARIEACGGRVLFADCPRVQGILAMSRAIGLSVFPPIDFFPRRTRDTYQKPCVTSEPEITFTKRDAEDECLILDNDGLWDVISTEMACEVARECLREENSDGLWDVISTKMACEVARECLREENLSGNHSFRPWVEGDGEGAIFSFQSASAAVLLTRLALGRTSYDNISVIVVDLKRNYAGR